MLGILRRVFSFADWNRQNPDKPPPGDMLDASFDAHANRIEELDALVSGVVRPDGFLANHVVSRDSLKPGLFRDFTGVVEEQARNTAQRVLNLAQEAQEAQKKAVLASEQAIQTVSRAESVKNDLERAELLAKDRISALSAKSDQVSALLAQEIEVRTDWDDASSYAQAWADSSRLWAEHMPDTLPDNALKIMDVTGDHWSSRWWANQAANAFGMLTSLYLGAHPVPPATNANGGPIQIGSIYYDTTTGQAMVWDGSQWNSFYGVQRAGIMTLWYNASAGQTVFSLSTPDLNGMNYTLDVAAPEGVEIHVNGLLAMPDPPTVGRWTLDPAANTITFKAPGLVAGDKVAIDVLMPNEKLGPGDVYNWVLEPLVGIDGVKVSFTDLDTADAGGPQVTINRNEELLVSVDGVIQQPSLSYNAIGDTITFTTAPSADSVVFIVWMRSTGGVAATAEEDDFVLKVGDDMSGHLGLPTGPGPTQAVRRDYVDDADAIRDTAIAGKVSKAGDTMTGNLTITRTHATIVLNNAAAGQEASLYFAVAGNSRWRVQSNSTAESGGNTGSNLVIGRYTDANVFIDNPVTINRATGIVDMPVGATTLTAAANDSSTKVATTAFATAAVYRSLLRNRVINSRMVISQERGTTGVGAAATGDYYNADMWRCRWNVVGGSIGSTSNAPAGGAPVATTNSNWMTMNVSAGKPTLAAADFVMMTYAVEGYHAADLQWGTPSAKRAILSFWTTMAAGTYGITVRNAAQDRCYITTFTTTNAGWQQITVLLPGDTTGTWNKTNGIGMTIEWVWAIGSTWHGVAGWQAGLKYGLASQTNAIASPTFISIAEVGLYADLLGDGIAPPFQMTDFLAETQACRRYYFKDTTGTNFYVYPLDTATAWRRYAYRLIPEMRIAPAVTLTASGTGFGAGQPSVEATSTINLALNFDTAATAGYYSFIQIVIANARM